MLFNSLLSDKQAEPGVSKSHPNQSYYTALQSAALFHLQLQQQNQEYLNHLRQADPLFLSEFFQAKFQTPVVKETKQNDESDKPQKRPLLKFSMDAILGNSSPAKRPCIRDDEKLSPVQQRVHLNYNFTRPSPNSINPTLDPSFKQPKIDQINYPLNGN